jgi:hypothetical protein
VKKSPAQFPFFCMAKVSKKGQLPCPDPSKDLKVTLKPSSRICSTNSLTRSNGNALSSAPCITRHSICFAFFLKGSKIHFRFILVMLNIFFTVPTITKISLSFFQFQLLHCTHISQRFFVIRFPSGIIVILAFPHQSSAHITFFKKPTNNKVISQTHQNTHPNHIWIQIEGPIRVARTHTT